jgi:hypothetical protein
VDPVLRGEAEERQQLLLIIGDLLDALGNLAPARFSGQRYRRVGTLAYDGYLRLAGGAESGAL